MADRCPGAIYLGNTMLKDWRLIFKSVATIEKDLGKYVPVGVFQITIECEKALDIYEDYPHLYDKKECIEAARSLNQKPNRDKQIGLNNGVTIRYVCIVKPGTGRST